MSKFTKTNFLHVFARNVPLILLFISVLNEFDFKVTDFRGAGRVPYLWKSMFITAELNR